MATFFTDDFADFTTCSGADCGDWTKRYRTDQTWTPAADVAQASVPSSDWTALTWDDIDGDANRANSEILIKFTAQASVRSYPLTIRASGADESATGYSVAVFASNFRTYYTNGADTPTQIATGSMTITAGSDYWIRFRVNSTTVQAKCWKDGTSEPSDWTVSAGTDFCVLSNTESTISAAGWVGLANYSGGSQSTFKQIGVGTNGDTAPSAAGGGTTNLIVADATHAHAADNLGLTSAHSLTVADATHAHAADNLGLTTQILLALAEAFHAHAADNLTLTLAGTENLIVADATHAHSADNINLTTLSVLVVAEALHSHLSDNLTLSLGGSTSLVVADATHEHYSGLDIKARPDGDVSNTGWTPSTGSTLWEVIDEGTASDADYISNPVTANGTGQVALSNIADPNSSTGHIIRFRAWNTGGNGWLSVALWQGATQIAAYPSFIANLSATPTTYSYTLSAAEANAITDYNDLRLIFSSIITTNTFVSWAEFSVSANIDLTTQLALSIAEAAHAHMVDGIVLTSQHVLAVADALHAHLADNITLSTEASATLSVFDGLHTHAADNLSLTSASLLAIADAAHAHLADNVSLTYAATLAIVESMHLHSADNMVLNFADLIGKLERIFTARSERRIFTAASERRIFKDE